MATSNDTRVRVEGRSKIIASVLPASGLPRTLSNGRFFIARADIDDAPAIRGAARRSRSRKCRTLTGHLLLADLRVRAAQLSAGAIEPRDAFGDFLLADDERRQQAHDIIAGGDREHFFGAQRVDKLAGRNESAQADQQTFAAHLGDQRRIAVFDFRQTLLEEQRDLA